MKRMVLLTVILFFSHLNVAQAFVIDGNVSDWGVSLATPAAKNIHYLDTHLPTGPHVDFVTEDNTDKNLGWIQVGPGWSVGNTYDAEAMYFDNDPLYAYIAIITGVSPSEIDFPAGDIFIDTGKYQDPTSPFYNTQKYQYGIDIATSKLYAVDSWKSVVYPEHNLANPWKIGASKTYLGDVAFAYSGQQNSHYVLEAKVLLSQLNLDPEVDKLAWLHWTMECGNDSLNLKGSLHAAPEPSSLALLGSGLFMGFSRFQRRKSLIAKK